MPRCRFPTGESRGLLQAGLCLARIARRSFEGKPQCGSLAGCGGCHHAHAIPALHGQLRRAQSAASVAHCACRSGDTLFLWTDSGITRRGRKPAISRHQQPAASVAIVDHDLPQQFSAAEVEVRWIRCIVR